MEALQLTCIQEKCQNAALTPVYENSLTVAKFYCPKCLKTYQYSTPLGVVGQLGGPLMTINQGIELGSTLIEVAKTVLNVGKRFKGLLTIVTLVGGAIAMSATDSIEESDAVIEANKDSI
jgi:hypothetical protein